MNHPYERLAPNAFWRSAVADLNPLAIDSIWNPKFSIAPGDAVSTAGSCFAQHIGRALRTRGFRWFDAEPAPSCLTAEDRLRFNYGVFSFRTSNIYTAAMLRQWMEWALGVTQPPEETWRENGRFFDPFRPAIEPDGFESEEELLASRAVTLHAIRAAIMTCSVFTFTLGLTEAWINKRGGWIYAACPGTLHGRYARRHHVFRNFRQSEVLDDLTAAFEIARTVNPDLRVLLTVSPVPLTATASGKHVLAATTYSKSTLRSAAGEYVDARDYADYFPAYELIASAPFRGMFFEPNLRSVAPQGVDFVMDRFFRCMQAAHPFEEPIAERATGMAPPGQSADDLVCEEQLLEEFRAA